VSLPDGWCLPRGRDSLALHQQASRRKARCGESVTRMQHRPGANPVTAEPGRARRLRPVADFPGRRRSSPAQASQQGLATRGRPTLAGLALGYQSTDSPPCSGATLHQNFSTPAFRGLQFWRHVSIGPWKRCWPYRGSPRPGGGVRVRILGRETMAARAAWQIFYGVPVPLKAGDEKTRPDCRQVKRTTKQQRRQGTTKAPAQPPVK
jgi:hypothetical protein